MQKSLNQVNMWQMMITLLMNNCKRQRYTASGTISGNKEKPSSLASQYLPIGGAATSLDYFTDYTTTCMKVTTEDIQNYLKNIFRQALCSRNDP